MKAHFEMFAAYNMWANRRLYEAAAELSDTDYRRDEKAFFGSVHGTLNHILVGDMIWMQRFTGTGPVLKDLNAVLHDSLIELRIARDKEDQHISDWVSSMSDKDFAGQLTYMPVTTPEPVTTKYAPAVAHFFNHQTHHRGQVHALLTRLSGSAPSLDLIYYQYERKAGLI